MTQADHLVVDHDDNQYVLYENSKAVGGFQTAAEVIEATDDAEHFWVLGGVWTEKARLAYAHELMHIPSPPKEVYLCAWTGGLEMPQYELFANKENAICKVAEAWLPDYRPDEGDSLDILRLDLLTLQIEDLKLSPIEIAVMASELLEGTDDN